MIRSAQVPSAVIMIRPHHFFSNPETAEDNSFQQSVEGSQTDQVKKTAFDEATRVAETLEATGIKVHVFEGVSEETPDCVFPNNWFSTHPGGHVAIFPMHASSRRKERRLDVIDMLKRDYRVRDVIDYSGLEQDGLILEGTGSMVIDHIERVVYAAKSNRTHPVVLERFCTDFNYEPVVFEAVNANGIAVYHTNVIMCIATEFTLVGVDMITDQKRRAEIISRLETSGREVLTLSAEQIAEFAGNALELQGRGRRVLALSSRAHKALTTKQITVIERSADLLPLDVPTIELSGGSVRCMLAGVHLSPR